MNAILSLPVRPLAALPALVLALCLLVAGAAPCLGEFQTGDGLGNGLGNGLGDGLGSWPGSAADPVPVPAAGDPPAATPVSVQLQWRHQWQFAGFYAAIERGYYRDAGLAVTLREHRDGVDIIDEVLAGRADFGTYYSSAIAEQLRGRPIRLLASYLKRSPLVILTRPGIYFPGDLKGRRLMAEAQELDSPNLRAMLGRFGLAPGDLIAVPHRFSVEPFVRGEVDAMTAFSTNEPYLLRKRGVEFNVIDPGDYGVALYDLNLFAGAGFARAHPGLVRDFVAATNRGWEYALDHPDALTDLILARYNTQAKTRDHLRFEANQIHSAMLPEIYPIGSIDPGALARIQALLVRTGLAAGPLSIADLVLEPDAPAVPSAVQPAGPGSLDLAPEERAALADHPTLKVAFGAIPPYAFARDGQPTGYTVELLGRMAQVAGLTLQWREADLGETYRALREGRADLTVNSLITPERESYLAFSTRRSRVPFAIFARADRSDIVDIASLKGKRLADHGASGVAPVLARRYPEIRSLEVAGYLEALEAVAAGQADAAILERHNGRYLIAEHGIGEVQVKGPALFSADPRGPEAALFAVRRELAPVARALDKAREALGTGERQALWDRWFHDPAETAIPRPTAMSGLTPQERAYLRSQRRLLAVYADAPPAATERGGRHTGYAVELIERAAASLGLTVELRRMSLADAYAAVLEGRADLILNAAPTPERREGLRFGRRTARVVEHIYARRDRPDLTDLASLGRARVAVWPGYPFAELLRERAPGVRLVQAQDYADAAQAVGDGRADAVILGQALARAVLADRVIANVAERGPAHLQEPGWSAVSHFAVERGQGLLAGLLDKAIDGIDPGELQRLHARWFGADDLVSALRDRIGLTDAERDFLAAHRDLVLGVDAAWAPLIVRNPDGSFAGIDADTAAIVGGVLGTRIRFKVGVWSELVGQAERREIDGLSSSAVHPERAEHFLFTVPYNRIGRSILVRAGNPLRLRTPSDLAGKRVGYGRGNLSTRKLLDSIAGAVPVELESDHAVLDALIGGQVDAMIAYDIFFYYLAERGLANVEQAMLLDRPTDLVLSIRKDWPLLVTAIDKVLTAIPQSARVDIKQRYQAGPMAGAVPVAPHLTADERAWLDGRGRRLTYCFSPVWTPYDFLEDGVHRGIFKDYLDLFADKLGVELRPLPSRDWGQALELARERRCDLVSGAVRTAERERYLAFTAPYMTLTNVLVARDEAPFVAGIESLRGKSIAVPETSALAASLRARLPDLHLVELRNMGEFAQAVASGEVYAAVATLEHAADLVEQGMGRFRIIGKLDDPYRVSIAVRNDAPELLSIMEKAVASVTPAEHDRLAQRRTTFKIEQEVDLTRLLQMLGGVLAIGLFLGYRHWELTRLNRRLIAAKEAAEAATRAKGDFLANMSHEIRTPLNAVLNLAALGTHSAEPQRLRAYLRAIERAGSSLLTVVNEILDFSRAESGVDANRPAPFLLADLVARIGAVADPLAADKGLAFHCELAPGLAERWVGDANKIERVLINLTGNALKFTERGRVSLRVRDCGPGSGRVLFEVEDTGPGIASAHRDDLFTPFHQGDNSPSRAYGGTGLGLAIVARLVALMQGEIQVESRPGEGTRFLVRLPLAPLSGAPAADGSLSPEIAPTPDGPGPAPWADRREPEPGPEPEREARQAVSDGDGWPSPRAGSAARAGRPRRVLAVEDNAVNRQILSEFLALLGLASELVGSGPAALACLDADPEGYGLVLMDVQMPGMDGYEATGRLRADPRFAGLPVVAVTAHVLPEDRRRCRAAGMDGHLPKPFSLEAFAAAVGRWVAVAPVPAGRDPAPPDPEPALPGGAAAAVDGDLAASAAPGWLDLRDGVARAGGDGDLYRRLLDEFLAAYEPRLAALDPVDGAGRRDELLWIAHNLRGSAAMLGAARLGAAAAAAEDGLLRGGAPSAPTIERLRVALAATLGEIRGAGALVGGPRATPESGAAAPAPAPAPASPGPAHILIVDDDPVAAGLLVGLLDDEHRVTVARDGAAGLALARARPAPDLILLDVVMGTLDGYGVCRALKADPATRDIPVIFVTGRGQAEDERRGLELGAVDYIHKPFERRVVRARVRNHLAAKRQGDALTRLSEQDSLTGLANRRRLDLYLAEVWRRAARGGQPLGLLMMDVDHFKGYNDAYGHALGDDCLRRIAAALGAVSRSEGGLVARYGGEEFVWIVPGADLAATRVLADQALSAVRALAIPHAGRPGPPLVTISIGVWSCRPEPGALIADCLAEADRRLYRAKSEGRDRVAA